ncbi:MAG: helix-turn-helix transcriptional regulator [Anaerolineae bacterium]|nr:helix-turn-helix transcriptional regulator [Anaerolineae bacterium]
MKPGVVVYREQRVREIALCVRSARIKAGWTQEQVAEHLGYSRAHVNRVEQGSAQLKVAGLELLSDAFEITLTELLERRHGQSGHQEMMSGFKIKCASIRSSRWGTSLS